MSLWPNNSNLTEFLIHGVKYAFPVERGGPTRGFPTAEAASPLNQHFPKDFPFRRSGRTRQVPFAVLPFLRSIRVSRRPRRTIRSFTNSLPS